MPVSLTALGELLALLLIISRPSLGPNELGANQTYTRHSDLGPIAAPHPLTIAKSPLAAMLEKVTGVVLLLF